MTEASQPFTAQVHSNDIETVYTTAASQGESTDWLTVVRNLRQGNRKLLEQVEKLEIAVAKAQQEALSHQERSRMQGVKIIQQDDDLKVVQERVGSLFEQLENSHNIGQRQQILVETLSQKLEMAQNTISEMEVENQQLQQQQNEYAQKLNKAEAVAQELYRRLKQHLQGVSESLPNKAISTTSLSSAPPTPAEINDVLSEPLQFEVEPAPPSWPAPATPAAAELKASTPSPVNLPQFQKKSAQS